VPVPPSHLDEQAKAEWARVAPILHGLGLLTKADTPALELYCTTYSRWLTAEIAMREHGMVVKSPSGYPIQNPYLSIATSALKQMKQLLAEFGMTPSSRTRVRPDKPEEADELDGLL
jgi:P27 family predicted phage terminase small subunit